MSEVMSPFLPCFDTFLTAVGNSIQKLVASLLPEERIQSSNSFVSQPLYLAPPIGLPRHLLAQSVSRFLSEFFFFNVTVHR